MLKDHKLIDDPTRWGLRVLGQHPLHPTVRSFVRIFALQ